MAVSVPACYLLLVTFITEQTLHLLRSKRYADSNRATWQPLHLTSQGSEARTLATRPLLPYTELQVDSCDARLVLQLWLGWG